MTTWGLLILTLTWFIVDVPSITATASNVFEPMVLQLEQKREERLTEPVTSKDIEQSPKRNISIVGNEFVLDGKPLRIVAGSLHYFRLPAVYWRDRLHKLKQAGLNSVTTYVEWSFHEQEERQYDFDGDRDIAQFISTAAEEGLHVILRVGPYICAERDLGGLPYWLLGKYPNIKLRTTDADFINESKIWVDKLFAHVSSLLYGNGGPIILVQVENEYGSYDSDMAYKVLVRDMIKQHVGSDALLFTTDGAPPSMFRSGSVPGALTTIDFNCYTNVQSSFQALRNFMPEGPLMNSEYYTGWLTHWGERLQGTDSQAVADTLGTILDNGGNVNFYMFFGGSNFEFTAGANYGGTYQPDITSYDYDSPLSEAGDPTPKYFILRDKLKQYNFVNDSIGVPEPSPKGGYGSVTVSPKVGLLSSPGRAVLGKKYDDVTGFKLPTFEQLRQRGGLVLYETTVTKEGEGLLDILKPRDMIFVYIDNVFQGRISRMQKLYSLPINVKSNATLSLLVENQGRINYGSHLHDKKGILSPVRFNNKVLDGKWTITGYPLEVFNTTTCNGTDVPRSPTIYEGQFMLPEGQTPLDTFLDTSGWGKGFVWVNGNNLGRYWPSVGPQITLYVPGVWLHPDPYPNYIQILELDKPPEKLTMDFIEYPILNRTGNIHLWR